MTLFYDLFETPRGWVGLLASERGLRRTTLPEPTPDTCMAELGPGAVNAEHDPDRFATLRSRIVGCLEGRNVDFSDVALDLDDAPPFMRAAWQACLSIPAGQTRTYKWLAAEAGRPNAPRAAGQSMARNRLPLIVPCHRVVASNGTLGGYGKGKTRLDLKQWLLEAEGATISAA